MRITLKRFAVWGSGGTCGRLSAGPSWECWALEAPWRDNQKFVSSVPAGLYELVHHNGTKYKLTWALKNHELGVGVEPSEDLRRYWCVLHKANRADQLRGCIAPGASIVLERGVPVIQSSAMALAHILGLLDWEEKRHELLIENCLGGWHD
jgi:hypothetical protein